MYIFQIFLTIGGGIKLIPLTGVTMAEELQSSPGRAAPPHCPGQQIEIIPGGCKYYKLSQIHFLKKLTWLYGIAGIVMLGMVLLYSEVTYGAEISFTIGITMPAIPYNQVSFFRKWIWDSIQGMNRDTARDGAARRGELWSSSAM